MYVQIEREIDPLLREQHQIQEQVKIANEEIEEAEVNLQEAKEQQKAEEERRQQQERLLFGDSRAGAVRDTYNSQGSL